jgi:hypothetical protein
MGSAATEAPKPDISRTKSATKTTAAEAMTVTGSSDTIDQ